MEEVDFSKAKGRIRLVAGIKLNFDKVRCITDIDKVTCEGEGFLESASYDDYKILIEQNDK